MKKEVLVAITGIQVELLELEENANEAIEIINPATYFCKDGVHYIFYEEMQEGSAGLVTQNKIIYRENKSLEVIKKGATNSRMLFSLSEYYEAEYETPYGEMLLGITTYELVAHKEESKIRLEAKYELAINHNPYACCEIIIKISDMEQQDCWGL